jgi:hypothetical protein
MALMPNTIDVPQKISQQPMKFRHRRWPGLRPVTGERTARVSRVVVTCGHNGSLTGPRGLFLLSKRLGDNCHQRLNRLCVTSRTPLPQI